MPEANKDGHQPRATSRVEPSHSVPFSKSFSLFRKSSHSFLFQAQQRVRYEAKDRGFLWNIFHRLTISGKIAGGSEMHSWATTPCLKLLSAKQTVKARGILIVPHFTEDQGERGKDKLRENKTMVTWGDFWVILPGNKVNKRKHPERTVGLGTQSFCSGSNHCGDSGVKKLVFGKGTRLSVTASKCLCPSLVF